MIKSPYATVPLAFTFAFVGLVEVSATIAAPPVDERELAVEAQETPLAAYGGRVVWSSYDPVRKVFAFKTFAGGRTVVVYSRCRREPRYIEGLPELSDPAAGSGCAVFRYDFATGREQRLERVSAPRGSETLPSIFGSRVAFARRLPGGVVPRMKIRDAKRTRDAGRASLGAAGLPTATDL